MKCTRVTALMVAAVLATASTGSLAALCGGGSAGSGFDDVQDTDNFCNSTQWLKNRGISLGCGAGVNYCPNDAVTRASMALFLNRTGVALTPRLVARHSGMGGSVATIQPTFFIPYCETPLADMPAANFPRTLRARGTLSAQISGSELAVAIYHRTSTNGQPPGGFFLEMGAQSQELRVASPSGDEVLHWSSQLVSVPPGTGVTVAIGLINRGGGTLTIQPNGRCAIEAELVNANPGLPPFDEQQ